ncbi:hypothetical protein SeLEV6574_g01860 [Synchytrium endobioticum]|uniref:Piwi domain-containing protein n=1 Tax=Synchytrium endobioticum TaxID=286115 RepID=A0A507DBK0_9FUNG|nr:hypothetical protein SeLEV6574_g01860 [Synchytrium endobioticum]
MYRGHRQPYRQPPPIHNYPAVESVTINPPAQMHRMDVEGSNQLLRPNYGTKGKRIWLYANLFQAQIKDLRSKLVFQYEVNIQPKTSAAVRRVVFENFKATVSNDHPGIRDMIYDGSLIGYSPHVLGFDELTVVIASVLGQQQDQGPDDGGREFTVYLKTTRTLDLSVLQEYMSYDGSRGPVPQRPQWIITMLDVLIRHKASMVYLSPRRETYFDIRHGGNYIKEGLVCHNGWFQSFRAGANQLLLNLDVAASAFYESDRLDKVAAHFFGAQSITPLWRNLTQEQKKRLQNFLMNVMVEITYRPLGSRKGYKIKGIDNRAAAQREIPRMPDETNIPPGETVARYYLRVHNIQLQYPEVPCVTSGTVRTLYLPMELLRVKAGQKYLGQLSPEQLAEMIKVTTVKPQDRLQRIRDGDEKLHRNAEIANLFERWGLSIDHRFIKVQGRVLNPPTITVGINQTTTAPITTTPKDGAWSASSFALPCAITLEVWSILLLEFIPNQNIIREFRDELVRLLIKRGVNVLQRTPPIVDASRINNVKDKLLKGGTEALTAANKAGRPPQLVICVLAKKHDPSYPLIKNKADTELGLMTQCVVLPVLAKKPPGYVENLSLKINAKLGGINSYMDPTREFSIFSDIPTMIMGADVSFGPPGSNAPTICSVVGSLDRRFSFYNAAIRMGEPRQEIITDLKSAVKELFNSFRTRTSIYPQRVIFFRDGLSEGRFQHTLLEIEAIKVACDELDIDRVRLTYIVITKRHHIRFIPSEAKDASRSGNCPPGTTIDYGVTHPFLFDYLQYGQQGLLGTSRPAHYTVLYDDQNWTADEIQDLCWRLCHVSARCNRSISLVAPVAYAHLVANRGRYYHERDESQGENPHLKRVTNNLASSMYFT